MEKEILRKLDEMVAEKVSNDLRSHADPNHTEYNRFILVNAKSDRDQQIGSRQVFSDLNRYSPHMLYADMLLQEYFGARADGVAREKIDEIIAKKDEIIYMFEESQRNPEIYNGWEDKALLSTDSWIAFLKDPQGRRFELHEIAQTVSFADYVSKLPEFYRESINEGTLKLIELSQGSQVDLDYAGALSGQHGLQRVVESIESHYEKNTGTQLYLPISEDICRSRIGYLTMDWARLVSTDIFMRGWKEYMAKNNADTGANRK